MDKQVIWLLEVEVDYEPGYILGAYSTLEKAKQALSLKQAEGAAGPLGKLIITSWDVDAD